MSQSSPPLVEHQHQLKATMDCDGALAKVKSELTDAHLKETRKEKLIVDALAKQARPTRMNALTMCGSAVKASL